MGKGKKKKPSVYRKIKTLEKLQNTISDQQDLMIINKQQQEKISQLKGELLREKQQNRGQGISKLEFKKLKSKLKDKDRLIIQLKTGLNTYIKKIEKIQNNQSFNNKNFKQIDGQKSQIITLNKNDKEKENLIIGLKSKVKDQEKVIKRLRSKICAHLKTIEKLQKDFNEESKKHELKSQKYDQVAKNFLLQEKVVEKLQNQLHKSNKTEGKLNRTIKKNKVKIKQLQSNEVRIKQLENNEIKIKQIEKNDAILTERYFKVCQLGFNLYKEIDSLKLKIQQDQRRMKEMRNNEQNLQRQFLLLKVENKKLMQQKHVQIIKKELDHLKQIKLQEWDFIQQQIQQKSLFAQIQKLKKELNKKKSQDKRYTDFMQRLSDQNKNSLEQDKRYLLYKILLHKNNPNDDDQYQTQLNNILDIKQQNFWQNKIQRQSEEFFQIFKKIKQKQKEEENITLQNYISNIFNYPKDIESDNFQQKSVCQQTKSTQTIFVEEKPNKENKETQKDKQSIETSYQSLNLDDQQFELKDLQQFLSLALSNISEMDKSILRQKFPQLQQQCLTELSQAKLQLTPQTLDKIINLGQVSSLKEKSLVKESKEEVGEKEKEITIKEGSLIQQLQDIQQNLSNQPESISKNQNELLLSENNQAPQNQDQYNLRLNVKEFYPTRNSNVSTQDYINQKLSEQKQNKNNKLMKNIEMRKGIEKFQKSDDEKEKEFPLKEESKEQCQEKETTTKRLKENNLSDDQSEKQKSQQQMQTDFVFIYYQGSQTLLKIMIQYYKQREILSQYQLMSKLKEILIWNEIQYIYILMMSLINNFYVPKNIRKKNIIVFSKKYQKYYFLFFKISFSSFHFQLFYEIQFKHIN